MKKTLFILIALLCAGSLFAQGEYGKGAPGLRLTDATRRAFTLSDTTRQVMLGVKAGYDPIGFNAGGNYAVYWHQAETSGNKYWVLSNNSTGLSAVMLVNDIDGTPLYAGLRNLSGGLRLWIGSSQNSDYLNIDGNNITIDNHFIPAADGTQNLGVATTGQWANVWADLVNGADFSLNNGSRILESEKYNKYYAKGVAFGNTHFKDGVVTEKMHPDAKPYFVATDKYVEFIGHRFYEEDFKKLVEQGIGESKPESFVRKAGKHALYGAAIVALGFLGSQL